MSTATVTPAGISTPASFHPKLRKRDGREMGFDGQYIERAIAGAFREVFEIGQDGDLGETLTARVRAVTAAVVDEVTEMAKLAKAPVDVEVVQDQVETHLMRAGEFQVAKAFIVFRENRNRARSLRGDAAPTRKTIHVVEANGTKAPINAHLVKRRVYEACQGLEHVNGDELLDELYATVYDGITAKELEKALVMVARQKIEREPGYNKVAVRFTLTQIYREVFGFVPEASQLAQATRDNFARCLKEGVADKRIDERLLDFNFDKLTAALDSTRDEGFNYLGIQTVYDRYLLHIKKRRIETPQYFFMRVAMGLALNEVNKEARAIEFYNLLSSFRFMSATPTLFNSGTCHPQLSSCYLTSVDDDLLHIFKCIQDNAMLSKWAGGLGNDWTRVRGTGSHIGGTNGESQGIVPFLKIVSDTAVAVNQGGKRKGAVCSYLESWHIDVEEFMELRKNTGDDRRRTHDMHTANWIPDLFMKRVIENKHWTLFSPNEVPDLHDTFGKDFERRYTEYEAKAARGEMRQARKIEAVGLWRKMLSMIFETGHPWITFKDPSNLRSPQDHCGVVHNSNLCTEILLNTSNEETAVCNLGSINMGAHVTRNGGLNRELLADTVRTAVRMLDNVIDINYYPTKEAETANKRHRPIGMGFMGFQDALYIQKLPMGSKAAVQFADVSMEFISYHAILASTQLAEERGTYSSYKGSKWDRGLLPIDTIKILGDERGGYLDQDTTCSIDWQPVREAVKKYGMRNSNTMAIAPTATISNIVGCEQSLEPSFTNLFVRSNLSGDFTAVNEYLINDLKERGIWDADMLEALKLADGSVAQIERVPPDLKALYQTAFEVDINAMIEATSRRQKWIDMGISFNLYIDQPSGKKLNDMYMSAWRKGLKTTYYLRSQGATRIEKSTTSAKGDTSKRSGPAKGGNPALSAPSGQMPPVENPVVTAPKVGNPDMAAPDLSGIEGKVTKVCSILNPDCEACQ